MVRHRRRVHKQGKYMGITNTVAFTDSFIHQRAICKGLNTQNWHKPKRISAEKKKTGNNKHLVSFAN